MLTAAKRIINSDGNLSQKSTRLLRWLEFRLSFLGLSERIKRLTLAGNQLAFYFEKQAYQLIDYYIHGEEGVLSACRGVVWDCDCFIDVGANRGLFGLALYHSGLKKAICIEPVYSTYLRLLRNITLNPAARIQAINAACSERAGIVRVTGDNDLQNGSALSSHPFHA